MPNKIKYNNICKCIHSTEIEKREVEQSKSKENGTFFFFCFAPFLKAQQLVRNTGF